MQINKRAFQFLCILIAFFMPLYGSVLPPLITILAINWLLDFNYREKFRNLKANRYLFLFSTVPFYLLHVVGLLYSANLSFGLFDLQVKLSLIVFPLIFFSYPAGIFNKTFTNKIAYAFLAGCVVTIFLFSIRAEINFLRNNDFQSLYYIYLGWYFHPSYLSMYFVFGLALMSEYLIRENTGLMRWMRAGLIIIMLVFVYFVFMLSSKAGIISMFLILMFFIILWMFRSKNYLQGIGLMVLLTGFIVLLDRTFPLALERMEEAGLAATTEYIPPDADGSSSSRLNTWSTAIDAVTDNPVIGVGTGDAKDELMKRYVENHNTYAITRKLNAHSQYLQSMVVLGIPGILLFLLMMFYPGVIAVRQREIITGCFVFLAAFNMLIESVLETQAGVIFYAFFNSIFLMILAQKKPHTPETHAAISSETDKF